jgi:DNA-binding beta-propeller fold protein YncE
VVPGSVVGATTGLAISPDGTRIAWSDCTLEVGVSLLVDAGEVLHPALVSGGRWVDQEPAGIPGTRRMLVVSGRGGPSAIWELDLSGAAAARTLPTPGLTPSSLAVSPDGRLVAFIDPQRGLFVMERDGGPPRRLVEGDAMFYPVFTHDGRALLYQVDTDDGSRVHVVDASGGEARAFLDDEAAEPAVSPAGDLIAVVVAEPGSADGRPVLIEPATGRRRALPIELAPGWYHNLRFSPRGDRLLWLEAGKVLREISLATGEVTRTYRSGTRQLVGVTYVGDELVVAQTGWIGDLWLGELSRAR